eukprot:7138694-Pyramimonas_sp.AAC.1
MHSGRRSDRGTIGLQSVTSMPASQAHAGCSVGTVLMKSAPRVTQQGGDVIQLLRAEGRAATRVEKIHRVPRGRPRGLAKAY